jgi:hypothetical protein
VSESTRLKWSQAHSQAMQSIPIPEMGSINDPRLVHARLVTLETLKLLGFNGNRATRFVGRLHGSPSGMFNRIWQDRKWFGEAL